MIAIEIEQVKAFMEEFLSGTGFDDFLFYEGKLTMGITYAFDGTILKDFFQESEQEYLKEFRYIPWKLEKQKIFSLIRGKKLPLAFRFVLMLDAHQAEQFIHRNQIPVRPEEVGGLFCNFSFEHKKLSCTTGVSRSTFVPDRTMEEAWDDAVREKMRQWM